jgi:hypothetical protein
LLGGEIFAAVLPMIARRHETRALTEVLIESYIRTSTTLNMRLHEP